MRPTIANDSMGSLLTEAMTELFGSRRGIAVLALIAFLAGIIGPFGTHADFGAAGRHLYWALIVFGTALPVQLVMIAFERRFGGRRPWLAWLPAAALVAALPVTAVVVIIGLGFGFGAAPVAVAGLYVQCAVVIMAIATVIQLLQPPPARLSAGAPAILRRVPGARRGRLIRLAAQDHYVEIVTDKGRTLVPMRFRDAIGEVGLTEGAQVHRSHWVAAGAVQGRRRIDGRTHLTLADGSQVPVGRTYRERARQAGLLV